MAPPEFNVQVPVRGVIADPDHAKCLLCVGTTLFIHRQSATEGDEREIAARALRLVSHEAMRGDARFGNVTLFAEERHEPLKRLHLTLSRAGLGKVTDQTDADPVLVEVVVWRLAMRPVLLRIPTATDFDNAITGGSTIADDEVVTELVPSLVAVGAVKGSRAARGRRTMMDDNGGPASTDAARRNPIRGNIGPGRGSRRGPLLDYGRPNRAGRQRRARLRVDSRLMVASGRKNNDARKPQY